MIFKILLILITLILLQFSDAEAKTKRSHKAIAQFKYQQPCPSTGGSKGACPGWTIDHVIALECGGADRPENMQWQTKEDAKAKDKWEREGCRK